MRRLVRRTMSFLDMIKIAHTVFALPFAIGAAFLAAGGVPPGAVLGKIVLAVFFARTAAMAFNRIADRRIDAANPRTAARALPRGVLSVRFVATATVAALAGFFATAAWINPLAFRLSPVAAAIILGYSLTKRWTALCHLVLGAGLALAARAHGSEILT
ncbi:MAG: UbiA family prenyltransferase, partial [Planctomycetota bacterium]